MAERNSMDHILDERQLVPALRWMAEQVPGGFFVYLADESQKLIIGDDMKLKQVIINILSNAIKFTDAPGSVLLTIERVARFDNNYETLEALIW